MGTERRVCWLGWWGVERAANRERSERVLGHYIIQQQRLLLLTSPVGPRRRERGVVLVDDVGEE